MMKRFLIAALCLTMLLAACSQQVPPSIAPNTPAQAALPASTTAGQMPSANRYYLTPNQLMQKNDWTFFSATAAISKADFDSFVAELQEGKWQDINSVLEHHNGRSDIKINRKLIDGENAWQIIATDRQEEDIRVVQVMGESPINIDTNCVTFVFREKDGIYSCVSAFYYKWRNVLGDPSFNFVRFSGQNWLVYSFPSGVGTGFKHWQNIWLNIDDCCVDLAYNSSLLNIPMQHGIKCETTEDINAANGSISLHVTSTLLDNMMNPVFEDTRTYTIYYDEACKRFYITSDPEQYLLGQADYLADELFKLFPAQFAKLEMGGDAAQRIWLEQLKQRAQVEREIAARNDNLPAEQVENIQYYTAFSMEPIGIWTRFPVDVDGDGEASEEYMVAVTQEDKDVLRYYLQARTTEGAFADWNLYLKGRYDVRAAVADVTGDGKQNLILYFQPTMSNIAMGQFRVLEVDKANFNEILAVADPKIKETVKDRVGEKYPFSFDFDYVVDLMLVKNGERYNLRIVHEYGHDLTRYTDIAWNNGAWEIVAQAP